MTQKKPQTPAQRQAAYRARIKRYKAEIKEMLETEYANAERCGTIPSLSNIQMRRLYELVEKI